MTQIYKPIETKAGIISGRDAIFLDEIRVSLYPNTIELSGELNSTLCSKLKDENAFIKYQLIFEGVLAFSKIELDFKEREGASSFDEVENSEWLNSMRENDHSRKVQPDHKHYHLRTYDDVFDIVCGAFEMTLLESRSKNKST